MVRVQVFAEHTLKRFSSTGLVFTFGISIECGKNDVGTFQKFARESSAGPTCAVDACVRPKTKVVNLLELKRTRKFFSFTCALKGVGALLQGVGTRRRSGTGVPRP